MKKIGLLFLGTFIVSTIIFGQVNSNQPTKEVRGITDIRTYLDAPNAVNILVLRDRLPWGINSTVPYLTNAGAIVSTGTSSDIPTLDFSQFNGIIIESVQSNAFKAVVDANMAKFEAFVGNGGCLEYHALSWSSDQNPMTLPGGVISNFIDYGYPGTTLYTSNNVVATSHPIATGQPSPFNGSFASHNIFSNLYAGTVVITESPNHEPTTIEYQYGNGRVTATGCTYEFYNFPMYLNNMDYTLACPGITPPDQVPLSNWALGLGIFLIVAFTVIRMRKLF